MNRQMFVSTAIVAFSLVPIADCQIPSRKLEDCRVTTPRATPEALVSHLGTRNAFWNENLYAASLWSGATVMIGPKGAGSILPDGSMEMKYPWFRAAGLTGRLTVTGRRLDAAAAPLKVNIPSGYLDTGFQATDLIFPTEGCWEITGKVGETTLTFVNRVIRAE